MLEEEPRRHPYCTVLAGGLKEAALPHGDRNCDWSGGSLQGVLDVDTSFPARKGEEDQSTPCWDRLDLYGGRVFFFCFVFLQENRQMLEGGGGGSGKVKNIERKSEKYPSTVG